MFFFIGGSSMFEHIKGVQVRLPGNDSITKLDLFNSPCYKGVFIFGRNGSGKSSIARWFKKYRNKKLSVEDEYLYDFNSKEVEFSDTDLTKIHVFDEEYIDKNIKVDSSGVNSIVILGESVGLDTKLKKAKDILCKLELRQDRLKDKNDSNRKELEAINHEITNKLRLHWAERERQILNGKRKSPVNDSVRERIIACEYTRDLGTVGLYTQFESKLSDFLKLNSDNNKLVPISLNLPTIDRINKILAMFTRTFEKSELTDREKYLISLATSSYGFSINDINHVFNNKFINICPFCMQHLSSEYKRNVCDSIKHVLTKEVEEFRIQLESLIIPEIDIDLEHIKRIEDNLVVAVLENVSSLNDYIQSINNAITCKIENPYEILAFSNAEGPHLISSLEHNVKSLNKNIDKYNRNIDNREVMKADLQELNIKLAQLELNSDLKRNNLLDEITKSINRRLRQGKKYISKIQWYISNCEAKKKNIKIAVKTINEFLQRIFLDSERIQVEVVDNKYILSVNGKTVKPRDISTGERNIIALCYFFTSLGENLEEDESYSTEHFIVIDDPISSFDFENKLGLTIFLKDEVKSILDASNYKSRIIMLSHDLQVLYDSEKYLAKLGGGNKFGFKEIVDRTLVDRSFQKRFEYSALLKEVYLYACKSDVKDFKVGNTLRRILEYYSTFLYKAGIENLMGDEIIEARIPSELVRSQFNKTFGLLVMNGYSHSQSVVQNDILAFEPLYSVDECIKTTKTVICFLYLLDKYHVINHLKENGSATLNVTSVTETIETWLEELNLK